MNRRVFVTGLGAILAAPTAPARAAAKMPRVGMLYLSPRVEEFVSAFEDGMTALGYLAGRNVIYEHRFADGNPEWLSDRVGDMLQHNVDVIVALNNPAIVAAPKATKVVPIVMVFPVDPVGAGVVKSLAMPGGNTTGLSLQLADVAGKRVQLLKEVVPTLSRLSVLWDPTFSGMQAVLRETLASASHAGLRVDVLEARSRDEIDSAFAALNRGGSRALIVWGSDTLFVQRARIAELAEKAHLPAICPFRQYVEAGCLMSYSARLTDLCRRAAAYVDRILKGANPAELPIEQPTTFEFVVNNKTAKALGVRIPPALLLRADQVIE